MLLVYLAIKNLSMSSWMITGANGNLGKRLLTTLLQDAEVSAVHAVVRSERAAQTIKDLELPDTSHERLQVHVLDYADVQALKAVAQHCTRAVHLVGILKETRQASYFDAHEASSQALAEALAESPVEHISYLSIVGSKPDAGNACLASKGAAEQILLSGPTPVCVLRVPMVLGEGDYASFALSKRARSGTSIAFRASSLEQPIYAGDVVAAVVAAGQRQVTGSLDLGGPEVLTRSALHDRAAAAVGGVTKTLSLPLFIGQAMAGLFSAVLANPPLTPAMLGVLDHDDEVDPAPALAALGLESLTPLDDMLAAVLGSKH